MKLSIIIVSFNTESFLRQCLTAVYGTHSLGSCEVIVVDNNSSDHSCSMIREDFPDVRLIESRDNEGFAKANNKGFHIAQGDYILLLNSDTKIQGKALEAMIDYLDNNPDAGIVTSRLVYPDLTDQGVARSFPSPVNALFGRRSLLTKMFPNNRYSKKYLLSRKTSSSEPFEVDWVSGACLMIRRTVIDQVGFLDENYFMYWEDADLCYRAKNAGWKVFCIPEALVIHYEGKSSQGRQSSRLIMEFNKSVYRFYRKHYITSSLNAMNILAIVGLSMRTVFMIAGNMLARKFIHTNQRRKEVIYEQRH